MAEGNANVTHSDTAGDITKQEAWLSLSDAIVLRMRSV